MFVKILIFSSFLLYSTAYAEDINIEKPLEVVSKIDELEKQGNEAKFLSEDKKQELRDQWNDLLGYDIWYPYFAVKGLEDYVSSKLHLPCGLRMRIKSSDNRITIKFIKEFWGII